MTMSAQLLQTCAVASQSSLQPRMYAPGESAAGILTTSTTDTEPQRDGWLPEQRPGRPVSSHGGGNAGSGVLSHVVQSGLLMCVWLLPQGRHVLAREQQFPVSQVLRQRGGIGFIAQVEPGGKVPLDTNMPFTGVREPFDHCRACFGTNSSGVRAKHCSVSGSDAGHRRYW